MTIDWTRFGYDPPLRSSSLPYLIKCPARAMLLYTDLISDEGGKAAQTGSLVHLGVEAFHQGRKKSTCEKRIRTSKEFPEGDRDEAIRHFDAYVRDPRNQTTPVKVEEKIELTLDPPDGSDLPIRVFGTLDQIREVNGEWYLFDVKTGKVQGWDMVNDYAYQVAAYCVGATKTFGRPVHPGALIRTQGYFKRGQFPPETEPDGVFFEIPWKLDQCYTLLEMVRRQVGLIRQGHPTIGPGAHCNWCPAGGIGGCIVELGEL